MCLIYLVLEGGRKSTKIGLAIGVKIGGDAAKNGKNTHLLVIMRSRLLQKICLLDLTNWNRVKKQMAKNNVQKVIASTAELVSCYIHASYYYTHTNVDLIGVYSG